MALILEVLPPGRHAEVRERHRLGDAPLTIGRALDNVLVLDDLHADAHHARVEPQPDGTWVLVDLGSVNGLGVGRDERVTRVGLRPGAAVTVGRTMLRVQDAGAPLPPALRLPRAGTAGRSLAHASLPVRLGVLAIAPLVVASDGWLEATARGAGTEIFGTVLAFGVLVLLWAGVWALAARVVLGRFHFVAHAAIGAAAVAVLTVLGELHGLLAFLAPAMPGASQLTTATALAAVAVVVPLHLQVATHLGTAARWRVGAIAAGIVLALLLVSHAVATDEFSPMAEFDATIRTVSPALVPQEGLDGFRATRADLKADVDRLLESAAR